MTGWLILDGLALLLAGGYVLSLPGALLPLPDGDVALREREARRRLWFPLIGSAAALALGSGSAWWDAMARTADHCGSTAVHEPYLCWLHPVAGGGVPWGEVAALAALAVTLVLVTRTFLDALRGRRVLGELVRCADARETGRAHAILAAGGVAWAGRLAIVPSDQALCFVFGLRKPTLVLSSLVMSTFSPEALAAMVAHEAAHVTRRDTLWRLLAQFARLVHAPSLGTLAFKRWTAASEGVCDATAAGHVGSRLLVAEALVGFRRMANGPRAWDAAAAGFAEGDLATRVNRLLADEPRPGRPWWAPWPWALGLVAIAATPLLHRMLEGLLRVIHAT